MIRLDQALVERGLCESREKAKRAVMAGTVTVNGQLARKASDSVKPEDVVALTAAEKFVSRGGHKLEHALKHFQLAVAGVTAIDLGASTGGFTDCLLQYGAAKVFAVDVGQGQLAWKLRRDRRVVVMEKTNARGVKPGDFQSGRRKAESGNREAEGDVPSSKFQVPSSKSKVAGYHSSESTERRARSDAPYPADLVVIDCSFISLRKILPAAVDLLRTSGNIVALIKPQFERAGGVCRAGKSIALARSDGVAAAGASG
jgi:23S rRNA (cytidine1920-2'-O)/16S rRNA (cytidine1409-2'-O)-methyltransferase